MNLESETPGSCAWEEDALSSGVAWTVPYYSPGEVDKAGYAIVEELKFWRSEQDNFDIDRWSSAITVMNNWRASHGFPLNAFQNNLRGSSRKLSERVIVAQRLKRQQSIFQKLEDRPTMRLSQMQDVGGCRVIVPSLGSVYKMMSCLGEAHWKHDLSGIDDYIEVPRSSGYRGIHFKFRYKSKLNSAYNGLRIEIQLRTVAQHHWATAVETVDVFTKQALKSSKGRQEWLRFFALMGSIIAKQEDKPTVPGTPEPHVLLRQELRAVARQIDAVTHLRAFGHTVELSQDPGAKHAKFFLLELDSESRQVKIRPYKLTDINKANQRYSEIEFLQRTQPNLNAVLVSVDSLTALKQAYPNYFLNINPFIALVENQLA